MLTEDCISSSTINEFKGKLTKIRYNKMGFLWTTDDSSRSMAASGLCSLFYTSACVATMIKTSLLTYLRYVCVYWGGTVGGACYYVKINVFSLFIVFILLCNELNTSIFGKLLWLCVFTCVNCIGQVYGTAGG